jgi:hypothetical protein
MAYIINKTNGSKLTTVDDGSVNSSAVDLTLIGKNYAGYGQVVNQNFIKLLENFANSKQPASPLTGQIWYDTTSRKIKFFNGSEFKGLPALESSQSEPTTLKEGDFWYNESLKKLYYYNGSNYTLIGPQFSDLSGNSTITPLVLKDTDGFSHYVLSHQIQSYSDPTAITTVAITSNDEFTIGLATPVTGFSGIRQGITLVGADNTGVSASASSGEPMLWGTAADSLQLGGVTAGDYVTKADPRFSSGVFINSANGLSINTNNLKLYIDQAVGPKITSDQTTIGFDTTVGGTLYNVLNIDAASGLSLLPTTAVGQLTNIGSASKKFDNIYANNFYGTFSGTVTGIASTATNANRLTTPRTISLGQDLSGSVSFDGSTNVTLNATVVAASSSTSATKWATPRTLTLSGDLTGSASFDGSSNFTLTATVAQNTISLGTDTVGIYVARGLTSGFGISGSVAVERGDFTVSLASTSSWTSGVSNYNNTLVYRDSLGNFASNEISAIKFVGTPTVVNIVKAGTTGVGDIGQTGNRFGTVWGTTFAGTSTSAFYADLAEKYLPDTEYEPGTVLQIGGDKEVTICSTYESEMVVGIVSTNPAYLMNSELAGGVAIALKGRVPCKVKGLIKRGDILVSSNVPGHAEARRHGHRTNPYAVIGKALQDFNGETGIIEVMVY